MGYHADVVDSSGSPACFAGCTIDITGTKCSCTFTAPGTQGTYTYTGRVDISGDGTYQSNEQNSKTLTVASCGPGCNGAYPINPCLVCNGMGGCNQVADGTSCTVCSGTSSPPTYGGYTDKYTSQSGTCSGGVCGSLGSATCNSNCGGSSKCDGYAPDSMHCNPLNLDSQGNLIYTPADCVHCTSTYCMDDPLISVLSHLQCCNLWGGNFIYDTSSSGECCYKYKGYEGNTFTFDHPSSGNNGACCKGVWHNVNSIPCCSDANCNGFDSVTHTKMVCDCPDAGCSLPGSSYSCKPLTCRTNFDCDNKYCCDKEVGGSGNCTSQGTIYASKYLCDPPGWSSNEESPKYQFVNLILPFFFNPFS